MSADSLESFHLGDLPLANTMAVAPMARNRADENGVVSPMMVTYYQQPATAGIVVTSIITALAIAAHILRLFISRSFLTCCI